jgi:pimeloyl-ACP methyl ester carboxylesterase
MDSSAVTFDRWMTTGARRPVRNRALFVVDRGPLTTPGATPVLLIHGFPTSAYDWSPFIEPLSTERRVVACDLLGFGLSDKPWPHTYSIFENTDYVIQLAADLGLKRAHIVSHDMGDTVVQEMLARWLERPSALPFEPASVTLLNGGVLVERIRPIFSQRLLRLPIVGDIVGRFPGPISRLLFNRSMEIIAGSRKLSAEELDVQFRLLARDGGMRLLPNIIQYMREREVYRRRWRHGLLGHPHPMRLVWGDRDPINAYDIVDEIVLERPATEAVRVAGAGHYVQLERPQEVLQAIREFITRHDTLPAAAA